MANYDYLDNLDDSSEVSGEIRPMPVGKPGETVKVNFQEVYPHGDKGLGVLVADEEGRTEWLNLPHYRGTTLVGVNGRKLEEAVSLLQFAEDAIASKAEIPVIWKMTGKGSRKRMRLQLSRIFHVS